MSIGLVRGYIHAKLLNMAHYVVANASSHVSIHNVTYTWTLEVCSQRSTTEMSIARQRFSKHVPTAMNKHTITWTVGDCDLYSVCPEFIKGGHVIDRFNSDSVRREFRRQLSCQVWLSVHLCVNQSATEAEELTDS
jgi:hypothetical protein